LDLLTLRDEQTEWLRAFPRSFWRAHTPELWNQLPAVVHDHEPLEFWDWKYDLTLRDAPDGRTCPLSAPAIDGLVREWAQGLARALGQHLLLAHTIALTDGERRPHVHGFLSAPPTTAMGLSPEAALSAWLRLSLWSGPHSIFERYDPSKGAVRYALDHGGLFIPKVACPRTARCRKEKCIGAMYPWRPADATMFEGRAADRRRRQQTHGLR